MMISVQGGGLYNTLHDKLLYEFEYSGGTMEQLTANITQEKLVE